MQEWILAFAAVTGLSTAGFVVIAVLWLRKLRHSVALALTESASKQLLTAQSLSESLSEVQKQQHHFQEQLQTLSQSNTQLRQGLVTVATQLQHGQVDATRVEPTIH